MKTAVLAAFLLISLSAAAQPKSDASFMIGNYNFKQWEKLDFSNDGNGRNIRYSYAKNPDGVQLKLLGTKFVNTVKVLMVQIPGSSKIYLIHRDVKNKRIQFFTEDKSYTKWFPWHYEGPVNGVGTFCATCAADETEAFEIVDVFF